MHYAADDNRIGQFLFGAGQDNQFHAEFIPLQQAE
jgi:hypothetical protein